MIQRYGTNDLDMIIKAEGLKVRDVQRWAVRFQDLFVRPVILILQGVTRASKRTLLDHALGHHFLHDGNQIWLRGYDRVWSWCQEHRAEEFAAYLTIPKSDELYLIGLPGSEVAQIFHVTDDLVQARIR